MLGAILVVASVVMRLFTRHPAGPIIRLGLDVVGAGIAFGLVVLVVFAITRIGASGRSRPSDGTADHRKGADPRSRPHPAAASQRHGASRGQGRERLRAGASPAGGGQAGRDGGVRSARPHVLNPTNVYSPGGLLDVPRDGRAPGTPGGPVIPEILRTAAPSSAGGRSQGSQDRPSAGWTGAPPPRPGYQPGMNPGGPGRAPYAPGSGQPLPGA
jgi:hypothetical protein